MVWMCFMVMRQINYIGSRFFKHCPQPLRQPLRYAKATIGFSPEFDMLDTQDPPRPAGLCFSDSSSLLRRAAVTASFAGGQENDAQHVARNGVLAQCATAADRLVIRVRT